MIKKYFDTALLGCLSDTFPKLLESLNPDKFTPSKDPAGCKGVARDSQQPAPKVVSGVSLPLSGLSDRLDNLTRHCKETRATYLNSQNSLPSCALFSAILHGNPLSGQSLVQYYGEHSAVMTPKIYPTLSSSDKTLIASQLKDYWLTSSSRTEVFLPPSVSRALATPLND